MSHDTFLILAVLTRGPAAAGEILDRVEAASGRGRVPTVPTLYRRLRDALEAGWIEVAGSDASAGPGRPGQRYELTAAGSRAARSEAARWRAVADLVLDGGTRG